MGTVLFWLAVLPLAAAPAFTTTLGQPTDRSVTVGIRSDTAVEAYLDYGPTPSLYLSQSTSQRLPSDPYAAGFFTTQIFLGDLRVDSVYSYRIQYRLAGSTAAFTPGPEGSFHTQRPPGSTFTFITQGDSHPERANTMFHPQLYTQTLRAAAAEQPDFYITNGDDFSVDTLRTPYTQSDVTGRYTLQLGYLNALSGVPIFLGTGNHEEASLSNYNLPPTARTAIKSRFGRRTRVTFTTHPPPRTTPTPEPSIPATKPRCPTSDSCATITPGNGAMHCSSS